MRRALVCSLWLAVALSLAIATGPSPAAAQGKPAPGPNQAFLYEMSENAVLYNPFGNPLVPDPTGQSSTGLIDATTGLGGIPHGVPVRRVATSQLQGVAALGSLLCPNALLVTIAKLKECTVTATGTDDVQLAVDPNTGQVVPTSGSVSGTYAVVVQLDNSVDSPELPLQTGTFSGTITFQAPLPLAFLEDGRVTIDGVNDVNDDPVLFPFTGTFRLPFAMSANGHHVKPRRGQDAFYLRDNLKRQPVRPDERAVGWPAVRLDITFPN